MKSALGNWRNNNLLAMKLLTSQLHGVLDHLLANTTSFVLALDSADFYDHQFLGAGQQFLEFASQQIRKDVNFLGCSSLETGRINH
jgi:hypothetical protein